MKTQLEGLIEEHSERLAMNLTLATSGHPVPEIEDGITLPYHEYVQLVTAAQFAISRFTTKEAN